MGLGKIDLYHACLGCYDLSHLRFVSWGEYPLSFAAVLGQEECYRLILSKGANHDLVDTNGNSVTHIMVVYDNMVQKLGMHGCAKG